MKDAWMKMSSLKTSKKEKHPAQARRRVDVDMESIVFGDDGNPFEDLVYKLFLAHPSKVRQESHYADFGESSAGWRSFLSDYRNINREWFLR